MTLSTDNKIRLFQIDGTNNMPVENITAVPDNKMSAHMARFTTSGKEIIVTMNRPQFFIVDIEKAVVKNVPHLIGMVPCSILINDK